MIVGGGDDLRQIFDDLSSSDDEEANINIEDMDDDTQDSGLDTRTATMMIEETEDSNMSKDMNEDKEQEGPSKDWGLQIACTVDIVLFMS